MIIIVNIKAATIIEAYSSVTLNISSWFFLSWLYIFCGVANDDDDHWFANLMWSFFQ